MKKRSRRIKEHNRRTGRAKISRSSMITGVLIVLVLITGAVFARYIATSHSGDQARVDQFVMNVETEHTETIPVDELIPGKSMVYKFEVSNADGDDVCEAVQAYTIQIADYGNLPLSYDLEKGNDNLTLVNNTAEEQTLPAVTKQVDQYTLTITWPDTELNKDASYSEEIDMVTVMVRSEQID